MIILFGIDCFYAISNANDSYQWHSTYGIVTSSKYTKANGQVGDYLDVTYSYKVNNVTYFSKNIDPVGPFYLTYVLDNGLIDKHYYATQFPTGSPIKVYYNPAHPSVSTIHRGWASSNYLELVLLLVIFLSVAIALFTFNKNPHLVDSFNLYERILITFFINSFVLTFSFIIVFSLLTVYIFFIIIISAILANMIFTTVNFLTNSFINLFPNYPLLNTIDFVLLIIFLFSFILMYVKAYRSLSVRRFKRYIYEITDKKIEHDIVSNKWSLLFSCSFNISDFKRNVTHRVNKRFSSEQKAEKFFEKRIKPIEVDGDNIRKKITSIPLATLIQYYSKGVVYVHRDSAYSDQEVIFSYQIMSIVSIAFIPLFFTIFDMLIGRIFNYPLIMISFSGQNSFGILLGNSSQILPNDIIMSMLLLVIGTEIIFYLYITLVLVKSYINYIYKKFLWGRM